VLRRHLNGVIDALLDRHRGHHDDELGEAVALVQLEDGAQIDVGLARAGLHLHGEVPGRERGRGGEAVAELNGVQVGQQLIGQQGQPVADAEIVFKQCHLPPGAFPRDGELRPAGLLSVEQSTDCFDGLELVVEVGLEVELHGTPTGFSQFRGHAGGGWL
jgi:hypothetical protein